MRRTESSALWALLLVAGGLQVAVAQLTDVCLHEQDGTRLPLATHCARFVVCQRGEVSNIGSCPRGLHFNRELGECDFQWRANCLGLLSFAGADDQCTCDCCADECQDPIDEEEEPTTEDCGPDTTTKSSVTSSPDSTDPTEVTTTPDDSSNSSNTTPASPGVAPSYCSSPRPECATETSGTKLEMPGVCVRFIQCSNGCVQEMSCPSGLYFSKEEDRCDYPYNVDCEPTADAEGEVEGPSGTTCSSQGVCAKQRDGEMFADPDSNGYLVCQCQCPIAMPCDPSLTFNETAKVCDWPKGSNSETGSGSGASAVLCPDGLVYNATSDQCDYPEGYVPEVPCNSTSTVCLNQPEGELFQVNGSCNTFYKCNYNCAVEQWCPNNLVFDPDQEMCVYPENYKCEWEYTPPSGPSAGPSGTSCESNGRCLGQREGTYFPSETNCGQFVVCQCECEVEMECPDGLYWDESRMTCNYASDVTCTL